MPRLGDVRDRRHWEVEASFLRVEDGVSIFEAAGGLRDWFFMEVHKVRIAEPTVLPLSEAWVEVSVNGREQVRLALLRRALVRCWEGELLRPLPLRTGYSVQLAVRMNNDRQPTDERFYLVGVATRDLC